MVVQLGCYQTARDTRDLLVGLAITSEAAFAELELGISAQEIETGNQLVLAQTLMTENTKQGGTTLSSKQIRVLQYVQKGLSNKQIADRLLVREDTVKWHMRKIFADDQTP